MDLREKKTRRSITNAFLQLRRQKPLERITVKELAELAEISKATFYLHYRDIFDLSDALQSQVIQNILSSISNPEDFLTDQRRFTVSLFQGFYAQQQLIEILFSGSQSAILPARIDRELHSYLHNLYPDSDRKLDMLLSYQVHGCYCVYQTYNKELGSDEVLQFVCDAARATSSWLGL